MNAEVAVPQPARASRPGGALAATTLLVLASLIGFPFAAFAQGAAVSADVRLLPLRRPVSALAGAAPSKAIHLQVVEDSLLAAHTASDFRDVRFVDGQGRSRPFLSIPPRLEDERWEGKPLERLDREVTGGYRGWGVEAGPQPRTAIVIVFPPGVEAGALRVEGTTDGRTWKFVHWATPTRVGRRRLNRSTAGPASEWESIRILDSQGWLRYRILDSEGLLEAGQEPRAFERRMTPAPVSRASFHQESAGFSERIWRTTLVLDGPPRALSGVEFLSTGDAPFRPERIEVRAADGGWRHVNQQTVPQGNRPGSRRWVPIRGDAVRLEVSNADAPHAPIRIEALEYVPHRFAFRPPTDGELWIAYGDGYVAAADWPVDPQVPPTGVFVPVSMGPEEPNPWFSPPGLGLEWLKRHPAALTGIMVLVLLGVAAVAWSTRSRDPAGNEAA